MRHREPSSFRDPAGFVFYGAQEEVFRQVNRSYRAEYDVLMQSGLYAQLVAERLLVPHRTADVAPLTDDAYCVIAPEIVPFISYPYEWCFSQLKDAALLTLHVQRLALEHGMTLKDASAFNVQFVRGMPVWIDSLSFATYQAGQPWVAYRQFCQHFLAPLALMSRRDIRLRGLQRAYLDGIPVDLAATCLPRRAFLRPGMFMHVFLHAKSSRRTPSSATLQRTAKCTMRRETLLALVDGLASTIAALRWEPEGTRWADYYDDDSYTEAAMHHKIALVEQYLDAVRPSNVWDLGANTGRYSMLAAQRGIPTIAMDSDEAAVERLYVQKDAPSHASVLPLIMDIMNPSPACGWDVRERTALEARGPADMLFALALVHHIAIGNNVPLPRIAEALARHGRHLVVEFVPKEDKKVRTMLALREDVFPSYTREEFERAFASHFSVRESSVINDSLRVMYRMERR